MNQSLRKAICFVSVANLIYFGIEFVAAFHIGSVSLFADSVDFLEDAFVNFLILLALGWSLKARARLGMVLAVLLLWPAFATLWMIWDKFTHFTPPQPFPLSLVGGGALMVNLSCAYVLARFRHLSGSLTKAAFYSARNDAFANIGIIIAGLLTFEWPSAWPDLIVGLGIAVMNADAAKEVWRTARKEHTEVHP